MLLLIGLLIGIVVTIGVYGLYEKIIVHNFPYKFLFNKEQKNIINNLKEKKDAQLKEISDEVLKKREETLDIFNQLEEEVKWKKDQYAKQEEEIKKEYYKKIDYLNKLQEEQQRARESKNEKLIQEETLELQNKVNELKKNYEKECNQINSDFLAFSEQINLKKESLAKEIEDYEKKQNQIIARLKEDELKKNERDFYKVKIDSTAKTDIQKLKNLAISFNKPDVIYKLIWEVYYKSLCEALFKRVLGNDIEKGGIYKITDITNEKVYIGRAVNFKERWRTHCKRGCGIEKIKGLLYDEMLEKGLENFTFEVVEICPKEEQAEKEKYWISFYHSDSWGYNQNKGG